MSIVVQVKNLSKKFDDIAAVNNLSFTVNEGDVYGFLGQNGAGKSTTIRMMLSLVKPGSGSIDIFGNDITTHRSEILKQIGAVIERPDLYKYLSAYDNLSIFARLSGVKVSRKLLMDQLAIVGLAERSHSKVKTFSQGMKQRLGIAVALVHDPKLIILDEPVNGLDPQGIADMRMLIKSLSKDNGKTLIISSHLLNEIEQVANRMIIIHKGEKVVEGFVEDLIDPSHTIVFVETNDNDLALTLMQAQDWIQEIEHSVKFIKCTMNAAEVPRLINLLSENALDIFSVQPRHSLEDYFLSLTNA